LYGRKAPAFELKRASERVRSHMEPDVENR
jgi:hypothetical protein